MQRFLAEKFSLNYRHIDVLKQGSVFHSTSFGYSLRTRTQFSDL